MNIHQIVLDHIINWIRAQRSNIIVVTTVNRIGLSYLNSSKCLYIADGTVELIDDVYKGNYIDHTGRVFDLADSRVFDLVKREIDNWIARAKSFDALDDDHRS